MTFSECFNKTLNLRLCGPFRVLDKESTSSITDWVTDKDNVSDKVPDKENTLTGTPNNVDLHMLDREWQCPPEFQPCFTSDTHMYGLWRFVIKENK